MAVAAPVHQPDGLTMPSQEPLHTIGITGVILEGRSDHVADYWNSPGERFIPGQFSLKLLSLHDKNLWNNYEIDKLIHEKLRK